MKYKLSNWIFYNNKQVIDKHLLEKKLNKTEFFNKIKYNKNEYFKPNFDIHNHTNNLLEYCNDEKYNKLWFDIDKIKIEINDLQNALTDFFDLIDKVIGNKLNRKSYFIYYKKLPNKSYTHSLRIINWYYKISYDDNKNLSQELLDNNNNNIIASYIDKTTSLYHQNRAIQLPYNTKIISPKYDDEKDIYGDLKSNDSNSHFFIDYNYHHKDKNKPNTENVEKYSISYIGNCKETLTFTTDKIEEEKIEQLQTNININYSNRVKKLLDTNDIINVLINDLDIKFYTAKYSKNWIGLLKLLRTLNLKDIDKFLNHSVNNGNKKDYNIERNKDLYNALNYNAENKSFMIKKYKSIYTYICNYLNNFQETYIYYTLEFSSIINELSLWISSKINIDKEIIETILNKYTDYSFKDFKDINFLIKINDEIAYNNKSSYLYVNDEIIGNFYVEQQYNKNYKDDNSYFDMIEDELIIDKENNIMNKNIENKLNEFINYDYKTLIIEAKCATGKSHHILMKILESVFNNKSNIIINEFLKDIINYENLNDIVSDFLLEVLFKEKENDIIQNLKQLKRQIIISPNNSLGKKEYHDIVNIDGNCFITHEDILKLNSYINEIYNQDTTGEDIKIQEKRDKTLLELYKIKTIFTHFLNCISSLESIDKIKITDNYGNDLELDTMYLDEFDTIMNKWDLRSKTFNGNVKIDDDIYIPKLEHNFKHFIQLCKKAKRIIILDAHINLPNLKIKKFLELIGEENEYKIKINYNKFIDEKYKFNWYDTQDYIIETIINNVKLDEPKIYEVATTSNNKAKDIFKSLICECYDDEINLIIKKSQRIGLVNSTGLYIFDTDNKNNCFLSETLFLIDFKDDVECSKSDNENVILNNKFNKIINHLQIEKCDKTKIYDLKIELQDNYEIFITEDYKFTTFIRTPTIESGLSLNREYFNKLFVLLYAGLFICKKSYQSFLRSRRLMSRTIDICCYNRDFNIINDLFDIEFIKKDFKIITNIGNNKSNYINIKKIDNDEKNTYTNIRDKDLKNYIMINELEKLNSDKFFYQQFFHILFYNGFKLNEHIFFKASKTKPLPIINEIETERKLINIENYRNTNLMDLTKEQLDKIIKNKKEDNTIKISNIFKLKYNKYYLLTNLIIFEPIYQYFLLIRQDKKLLAVIEDHNQIDDNKEINLNFDDILSNNIDYFNNSYNDINSIENIDKFNLSNYNNSIKDVCEQLKRIVKLLKSNVNDNVTEPTDEEKIKIRKDKNLITLTKFLGIDLLKDYNKKVIKRYVFDNSNKFQFITGFKNEIINNTNTLDIDGVTECFLLWIEKNLLYDYNKSLAYKNHKTKLDPNKDMNLIKNIINFYLHQINLFFDYQYQYIHSSRNDKTLQFYINKKENIKIITDEDYNNDYKFNIKKYYFNNKKIKNDNIEEYEKQFIIINNKQDEYFTSEYNNLIYEKYIKDDTFKKTLFFKDDIDDEIFINKDNFKIPTIKFIPNEYIKKERIKVKRDNKRAVTEYKYYYKNYLDEDHYKDSCGFDGDFVKIEVEKELYNNYTNTNEIKCNIEYDGNIRLNFFYKYNREKKERFIIKKTDDKQKKLYIIENEINRNLMTYKDNEKNYNNIHSISRILNLNLNDKLIFNSLCSKHTLMEQFKKNRYNKEQSIIIIQDEQKYMKNLIRLIDEY